MQKKLLLTLAVSAAMLAGCQSNPSSSSSSNVRQVNSNTSAHLQAELTMADYTQLASKVTDKMLASRMVQKWGKRKPRLIVAKLRNNTDNENLRMADIYDRISEDLLNSGTVRLVHESATSFDYVVRSELTSNRQYGKNNEELVGYALQFKMFNIDGEMLGQWSGNLTLAKGIKTIN